MRQFFPGKLKLLLLVRNENRHIQRGEAYLTGEEIYEKHQQIWVDCMRHYDAETTHYGRVLNNDEKWFMKDWFPHIFKTFSINLLEKIRDDWSAVDATSIHTNRNTPHQIPRWVREKYEADLDRTYHRHTLPNGMRQMKSLVLERWKVNRGKMRVLPRACEEAIRIKRANA